jgi:hypothetical protein
VTEYFDAASAKQRYRLLEDAALITIVHGSIAYAPQAVALAQDELSARGITGNDPVVPSALAAESSDALAEKDQPLHGALRALCFVLTPLPALVIAIWHFASGRKRAAKDALAWMFYGLVTWIALRAILLSI